MLSLSTIQPNQWVLHSKLQLAARVVAAPIQTKARTIWVPVRVNDDPTAEVEWNLNVLELAAPPTPPAPPPNGDDGTVDAAPVIIETTELYWDCECDADYIHPKAQAGCERCGVLAEEMPDARVNEVAAAGLPMVCAGDDGAPCAHAATRLFRLPMWVIGAGTLPPVEAMELSYCAECYRKLASDE